MSINKSSKLSGLLKKPFLADPRYIAAIWMAIAVIAALKQFFTDDFNNYLIFKHVFYHTVDQISLYAEYPDLYKDHNHYGPFFSIVIAPFALLPDVLGMTMWNLANAAFIIWAVFMLPLEANKKSLILWISAHEFLTAALSFQFNPSIAAIIILSFVFIDKKKDFWAAMLIVAGTFIKLYGVVGLAFFFFSKDKIKFILSLVLWGIIFFLLPMLISSPQYLMNSYLDWYERLIVKNNLNVFVSNMQDISLMGLVRKVSHSPNLSNMPFILGGLLLLGLTYLKIKFYKNPTYRLLLLSSVLIFTVIFSTGSESPTYIIAFMGIAIWFSVQNNFSFLNLFLLLFAIILSSLSPSDLFPAFVRENYIKPYALKALPVVLIWFKIVYDMLTMKNIKN